MAEFITGNRYLTADEQKVNARYICDYLSARGWTLNAIAGLLGNMQTESTINPGIWQSLNEGNTSGGYGLVQWTPATKYLNWCVQKGIEASHMDSALERLEYELENGLQYYKTSAYPISFRQFKTSTKSPEYLGQAFMRNYERPANQSTTARGQQALAWYEYLTGAAWEGASSDSTSNETNTPTKKKMSLLMLILAAKRKV